MDKKLMELLATDASWLTRAQLSGLTRAQLSGLTGAQLSGLTGAQLSWLTRAQLSGLTGAQLSGLTGAQLSGLTGAQLSSWLKLLEGVEAVPNLYSKILERIKSETALEQSTFGPAVPNACGSPMCIAGHTVAIAGDAGWKLRKEFGFATAAGLIHRKSCPDAALPRYDSYPNEWARAYIEARAAEETA